MIHCPNCNQSNRAGARFCTHCGASLLPRDAQGHLLPGTVLEGHYRLDRVLGAGGFGAAYLAEDSRLQRACVVKEMLVPPGVSAQKATDLRRNFEREAHSLVALNQPGHPNIPEIYDFFSVPSGNYLVMKYIEGENLEELMARRGGRLPWQQAVKYTIAVCDALAYMHNCQPAPVLHRDIKPANILVDQVGRTWLVDFGLSKAQPVAGTGTTGSTTAVGTPGYTPLEQWLMRAVPASDVYALGATLHHLVTGRDPRQAFPTFDLHRVQQEHGNFPPLQALDPALPAELERLVAEAVQTNPQQRPKASQWKQAMEALVAPQTAQPFTFRSSGVAHTPKDLVLLCNRSWDEARGYLHGGQFEKWFAELNRHDLVANLKAITGQERSKDIGLDKFLRTLDPSQPSPRMSVSPSKIGFGRYDPSAESPPSAKIQIHNQGPGCLYGSFKLNTPWLHISQQDFALAPGKMLELEVRVKSDYLSRGGPYQGQLVIDSNGGQVQVDFSLRTPAPLLRRGVMLKLFGFDGGFFGGVWGAILGTPLWVLTSLLGLGAVFRYLVPLLDPEFQGAGSWFDESLLHLAMWNALIGLIAGKSALGSKEHRGKRKSDKPISVEWGSAKDEGVGWGSIYALLIASYYIVVTLWGLEALEVIIISYFILIGFATSITVGLIGLIIGFAWAVALMSIRLIIWGLLNLTYPVRRRKP